jgi:hypothetical protein
MTNEQIKSGVAAVVLAAFDLLAVVGFHLGSEVQAVVTTFIVLAATYFAPRIRYLAHAYAGAVGSVVGLALGGLNLLVTSTWHPSEALTGALSALIVAVGALAVPSLVRSPDGP